MTRSIVLLTLLGAGAAALAQTPAAAPATTAVPTPPPTAAPTPTPPTAVPPPAPPTGVSPPAPPTAAPPPAPPTSEPAPAPPAEDTGAAEIGPWSAGMEAISIEVPNASNSSLSAVALPATAKGERGQFFAVPIPRSDPAFGSGLIGVAAYIFKLNPNDNETPPSVLGAGAFWLDSHSWGGALAGKFYMGQDRVRLLAALAYADLRYDLTATSETTGSEQTIPLRQEVYGGLTHTQFRVAPNIYVGARIAVGKVGTFSSGENVSTLPPSITEFIDGILQLNSVGPSFALDTRDSTFYPRRGVALDASVDIYFGGAGSDLTYDSYVADYRQYATVRGRDVLAWQAYLCAVDGSPPFFLQCQVGPNSLLRGYGFGRYRGDAMAAVQAEYRWEVHRRWIVAVFAGATQVGPQFDEFKLDETLYAGGVGLRFVVEPKNGVTLRADYAWGEDERAFYVSVGEAF